MAEGGFVVKIDGKMVARCYSVTLDYDEWKYILNETDDHELPANVESIAIEVERK